MSQTNKSTWAITKNLTRLGLSSAIAFSTLAGYIAYSHKINLGLLFIFIGVLLLSGAASVLNQYQERKFDALMKRTQNRPLPANQIKPPFTILIASVLGILGLTILYFGTTPLTAYLGAFNLLWYNAVYTPLKRKTQFVVLVGALTGAIPPIMGWTAAGGSIIELPILIIAFFMFIWQIPHFFLLIMKFGKEYENAGFRSISSKINDQKVKLIVFIWIIGTVISTLFFPLFHVISNIYVNLSLVIFNIVLIIAFYRSTFLNLQLFNFKVAFRSVYLYQVIVLLLLMIDALKY
jgi:heme o synthase